MRQIGTALQHRPRRTPFGPCLLAADVAQAMPSEARASDTDAIAIGLSAGKREIERAFRGDDRDRARTRMRRIGDELARRLGKLPGELLFLGRLRILLLGREVEKRE